jgi:membrane-bound lytic murein transglycosylase D
LLKALGKKYNGNWELALAAYNNGSIDRSIARTGVANFWAIYPHLVQQTRDYVPNILATILIAKNPEKYGFGGIRRDPPLIYERVPVSSATSLRLVADLTDTSLDYIQSLNPELRRDTTPRGDTYMLRIPTGKSKQLASLFKHAPADRLDSARVIGIAPGEDLQSVANRTGVSVATLQSMNPGVDFKTTTKLFAPANSVRLTNWRRSPSTTDITASSNLTKVRARKGDTISKIAGMYKLSAADVARLNGIGPDVELQAGQEIRLPTPAASPNTRGRR